MARNDAEFRLACVVHDTLRLRGKEGLHFFAVPNGEARSPKTGARLKRQGVRAGEPDLILLWNKRAIGLELKAEGGRQSPEQRQVEQEWTAAGSLYRCVKGYDEAIQFLDMLGVLKPDYSLIRHQQAEVRT